METHFAPAGRSDDRIIIQQNGKINESPLIKKLYNAVSEIVLILNKDRQIVFYNDKLTDFLPYKNKEQILGSRPGEMLNCMHAFTNEGGCGTSEFCSTCGAVKAIINSQKGKQDIQECRITQKDMTDSFDIQVTATPLKINNEDFTVFSIKDISAEKRKLILERLFFHDILNTAGSLRSLAELLQEANQNEMEFFRNMFYINSDKLIEEIVSQRDLIAAENNDYNVKYDVVNSLKILENAVGIIKFHEIAKGKEIKISSDSVNLGFITDRALLFRVLTNLLKNALEAIEVNSVIETGCLEKENEIEFFVKNNTYIPRDIQLQIFKRSFSTKGNNRGLGTYSIKLFTEKYLKGEVWFTSSEKDGTTFFVKYPRGV